MAESTLPDFSRGTDGLLPAIAQDHETGRVLMLAWMSRESFAQTLATKRAVYFSRSRNQLWRKGERSGHIQQVVEIQVDCDGDAILLRVRQVGAACHMGYRSCFFRRLDDEGDGSWRVAEDLLTDPADVYNAPHVSTQHD